MLKRFLSIVLCAALLLIPFTSLASAAEADARENTTAYITYFEDGSYCVTTITEYPTALSTSAAGQTKRGSKTVCDFDSSGKQLYSLTVYGTFTYNGSVAKATASSYSYTVDNSSWSFVSGSSSIFGACADATASFKLLGIITKTLDVRLMCSPSGVLS